MLDLESLIKPTDKQREWLQAIADYDFALYGGAAGGGKSYILRWWLVLFLCWLYQALGIRNVQVGLFCEDYPSLRDRHISKIKFEFPDWLGALKQGDTKNFELHPEFGGGIIALRNLDDPSKYLSTEFAAIAVDELTRNDKDVFDFLRLRLRWPGVEHPKFGAATNPGGKGHKWVRKLWLDHQFDPELAPYADQFAFVQAKASDNPHLTEAYYRSLRSLPKPMADAYAAGSWDLFVGQYFDIFTPSRHVVGRVEDVDIQPWWPKWISVDWGFNHPSAVYWHTRREDGKVFTYREFVQSGLSPRMLGQAIAERSRYRVIVDGRETLQTEPIKILYLSPDAFAHRTAEASIAEQLGDVLSTDGLPRPTPADDDRIGGWQLWYGLLENEQWAVTANCAQLIECIPSLIRDEKNVEDIAKVDGDDPADSCRYGIYSMLRQKVMPWVEQLKQQTKEITDPTARAIFTQRLIAKRAEMERRDGMEAGGGGRLRWQRH